MDRYGAADEIVKLNSRPFLQAGAGVVRIRRLLASLSLIAFPVVVIPVAITSSGQAGAAPSVSLTDLNGSFSGTVFPPQPGEECSSYGGSIWYFRATYPGSAAVGTVTLDIEACAPGDLGPSTASGSFTVSTNVGTLSGNVAGSTTACLDYPCFELTLTVSSGSGAFAATTGNIDVSIQPLPGGTYREVPTTGSVTAIPTTSVLVPSTGATLSGSTVLDASASNATSVEFLLFGGSFGYSAPVLCTATLTYYGWLCSWNSATVPNGSYNLLSEAFNPSGSAFSSGTRVTVKN